MATAVKITLEADDKITQIIISICARVVPQLKGIRREEKRNTQKSAVLFILLTISSAAINLCGEAMAALLKELLTQVQDVFLGPPSKVLSRFGSTSSSLLLRLRPCRVLCEEGCVRVGILVEDGGTDGNQTAADALSEGNIFGHSVYALYRTV